jgi:hypothetical protein
LAQQDDEDSDDDDDDDDDTMDKVIGKAKEYGEKVGDLVMKVCAICLIPSYRYTVAMFPLPIQNVLKYHTRENVGCISIFVFNTKCTRERRPHFAACGTPDRAICFRGVHMKVVWIDVGTTKISFHSFQKRFPDTHPPCATLHKEKFAMPIFAGLVLCSFMYYS